MQMKMHRKPNYQPKISVTKLWKIEDKKTARLREHHL